MSTDPREQGGTNPDDPTTPDPVEDDSLMEEDGDGMGQQRNPDDPARMPE